jgi:hypothetical protein
VSSKYVAGEDAKTYVMRLRLEDEAFRMAIAQQFLGPSSQE